jgi:hypothetical protein
MARERREEPQPGLGAVSLFLPRHHEIWGFVPATGATRANAEAPRQLKLQFPPFNGLPAGLKSSKSVLPWLTVMAHGRRSRALSAGKPTLTHPLAGTERSAYPLTEQHMEDNLRRGGINAGRPVGDHIPCD